MATTSSYQAQRRISEHFAAGFSDWDQWSGWYNDTTFDLPFTDAAVAHPKAHELTLTSGDKSWL